MVFIKLFLVLLVKCITNERGSISLTDGGSEPAPDPASTGGGDGVSDEGAAGDPSLNDGGSAPEPVFSNLPEDLRDDPSLKVFIDDKGNVNYENLAKSYVHAQRKMGEKGIQLPTDASTPEEWADFYNKMRPESLDQYEIKNSLDDGQGLDEDLFKGFKKEAHQVGLSAKQAQTLVDWFNKYSNSNQQQLAETQTQAYNKEIEDLQKEWGEGFKTELSTAQRAVKEFADEKTLDYLKQTGLDKNVTLIKMFNKIGKGLLEDKFDSESHGHFGMTKEAAMKKMNAVFDDQNHAYWNSHHASHAQAVEEMAKLSAIANS